MVTHRVLRGPSHLHRTINEEASGEQTTLKCDEEVLKERQRSWHVKRRGGGGVQVAPQCGVFVSVCLGLVFHCWLTAHLSCSR